MKLRTLRRKATAGIIYAARAAAPFLPLPLISALESVLRRAGPHAAVLGKLVADNMRAAGFHERAAVREYFAQVARHLANAVRVFRLVDRPAAVEELAASQIDLDPSIQHVHDALSAGRGVLLAPGHTVNFVLTLTRLNMELPVCVLLRWSADARKLRLKQEWCRAAGLRVVMEPPTSASPIARAAACVDVLRENVVLAITPDIAQKRGEGVPVPFFGRTVFLPAGPASIALVAEAPFIPLFGRLNQERLVLYAHPPVAVPSLPRTQGGRRASLQQAMGIWATCFEEFIRACPAAWFLWADSRWTRVFRNDPEYVASLAGVDLARENAPA